VWWSVFDGSVLFVAETHVVNGTKCRLKNRTADFIVERSTEMTDQH